MTFNIYPTHIPIEEIDQIRDVLSLSEASRAWGLHPNTVRDAIVTDRVIGRKLGHEYIVSKSSMYRTYGEPNGELPHVSRLDEEQR